MKQPFSERREFMPDTEETRQEKRFSAKLESPVVNAFAEAGLPLGKELVRMLRESREHRYIPETAENNRKGSGFLQAWRSLAERINVQSEPSVAGIVHQALLTHALPRLIKSAPPEYTEKLLHIQERANKLLEQERELETDTLLFKELELAEQIGPSETAEAVADQASGLSNERHEAQYGIDVLRDELHDVMRESIGDVRRLPIELWQPDPEQINSLRNALESLPEGDRLIGRAILDLISPITEATDAPSLPFMKERANVGTCTTAETYYVRQPHYNIPDIVVDEDNEPVMLIKNAGERSALTLTETVLNGVRLPKGSMLAIDESAGELKGVAQLSDVKGVRFLRLSTLAISPQEREEAVGTVYKFQKSQGMRGFDTLTIDEIKRRATYQLKYPADRW